MNPRLTFSRPTLTDDGRVLVNLAYKTSRGRNVKVTVDLEKAVLEDAKKALLSKVSPHLQISERGIEIGAFSAQGMRNALALAAENRSVQSQTTGRKALPSALIHPSVNEISGSIVRYGKGSEVGFSYNGEIGYGFDEIGWDPFSAIGDAVSSVVETVVNVAAAPIQAAGSTAASLAQGGLSLVNGVVNSLPLPDVIKGPIGDITKQAAGAIAQTANVTNNLVAMATEIAKANPAGAAKALGAATQATANLAMSEIQNAIQNVGGAAAIVKGVYDDPRFKTIAQVASYIPGPWQPIAVGITTASAIESAARGMMVAVASGDPKAMATLAATIAAAQLGDPKGKLIANAVTDLTNRAKVIKAASEKGIGEQAGVTRIMTSDQFSSFLDTLRSASNKARAQAAKGGFKVKKKR